MDRINLITLKEYFKFIYSQKDDWLVSLMYPLFTALALFANDAKINISILIVILVNIVFSTLINIVQTCKINNITELKDDAFDLIDRLQSHNDLCHRSLDEYREILAKLNKDLDGNDIL